jgi:8-oxo-dGTP diphosphatase
MLTQRVEKPPGPRLGSAVVVVHDDRVLLGRRAKEPNRGKWVLPGGKIEPFESIREAAEREIREETGLDIHVEGQVGAFEIIRPPQEHRVVIYSWARHLAGEPTAASDISELRFFSRAELPSLDLSGIVAEVLREVGWLEGAQACAA